MQIHVCGNEEVRLIKTSMYREIKSVNPPSPGQELKYFISDHGLMFESSSKQCKSLLYELC